MDWEPDHIELQSRVPAVPLVPLGEWPTWPRPSKWQKWALQAIIYIWNYILWQFSHLYLHHLITYSYTQYSEMLYGIYSLQTNLCISLHYQSDVLQHTGSNYEQLLFSSDIWAGTCAMGICAVFYMWHWFGVVEFNRCMVDYWGANDIVTTRERGGPMCICDVKWWRWWNGTGPVQHSLLIAWYKIQCTSVAVIYAQFMGGGICHTYMCMLWYVKRIQCSGVGWISDQLPGGSICHTYMCLLLYMKLIWCSGVGGIYDQLRGVHLPCIYVHASIC